MSALNETYKHILLITETVHALYLLPWLSSLPQSAHVTILQLNAGISGFTTKNQPDLMDISLLLPYANIQEAYDLPSLTDLLKQSWKNYIRVSAGELPTVLFPEKLTLSWWVGNLTERWFSGIAGTVLVPAWSLIHGIHGVQQLQDQWTFFDLFVLSSYDFTVDGTLKESILRTKKLIVLLDQQRRTHYESVLKAKLWEAGLSDVTVHFLYPNTDKINTILPEYLWEQAHRDGAWIAAKMQNLS